MSVSALWAAMVALMSAANSARSALRAALVRSRSALEAQPSVMDSFTSLTTAPAGNGSIPDSVSSVTARCVSFNADVATSGSLRVNVDARATGVKLASAARAGPLPAHEWSTDPWAME